MKKNCIIFLLSMSTLIFTQKPERFSHNDMRMIMEKNAVQLKGMKISSGALSARFGVDSLMCPKVGVGYRSNIDWTYPLAFDVGANVFYNTGGKKQTLAASLESSLYVLFNTTDELPIYFGVGAEMKSSAVKPLFEPETLKVPGFMYKIPMPDPCVTLGKTLINDSFIQLRVSAPIGAVKEACIGLNYGFGF